MIDWEAWVREQAKTWVADKLITCHGIGGLSKHKMQAGEKYILLGDKRYCYEHAEFAIDAKMTWYKCMLDGFNSVSVMQKIVKEARTEVES